MGSVKDAAGYYIQASETGGEPPGRWWGPAAKGRPSCLSPLPGLRILAILTLLLARPGAGQDGETPP